MSACEPWPPNSCGDERLILFFIFRRGMPGQEEILYASFKESEQEVTEFKESVLSLRFLSSQVTSLIHGDLRHGRFMKVYDGRSTLTSPPHLANYSLLSNRNAIVAVSFRARVYKLGAKFGCRAILRSVTYLGDLDDVHGSDEPLGLLN